MRFLVMVKSNPQAEGGALPDEKFFAEMDKYNDALKRAGVLLAAEGLHPSARGARVRFSGKARTVIDGPFTESKELVAGFWLWQVKSKDEAIEWLKRSPFQGGEVEMREVFESAELDHKRAEPGQRRMSAQG